MIGVTGATGHLGTVLVRQLVGAGQPVRYLARRTSRATGLEQMEGPEAGMIERVDADLTDESALARAFRGVRLVYHCAGLVSFMPGNEADLFRVNVEGTRSVLRAARAAGVRRVIHVGSIEAFPLADGRYPITEEHGIHPERTLMTYGRTKATSMLDALAAADTSMEVVVCAPTAFLGPTDYRRSPIGQFVLDYLQGRLPAYIDGGFDFVDVRDVADGVIRAAAYGASGRVYLLSGRYTAIPELIGLLHEVSGISPPPFYLPARLVAPFTPLVEAYYRLTGVPARFTRESLRLLRLGVTVSAERARAELGFTSRPIRETLGDSVDWFARRYRMPGITACLESG